MPGDIAELGMIVDSKQVDAGTIALGRLSDAANKMADSLEKMNDKQKKTIDSTTVWGKSLEAIQRQMIALSGGLGFAGTLLAGMGTTGLVAAAGIGAVVKTVHTLIDMARGMGDFAEQMKNTAQTVGVTTDALQALNIVAQKTGISAEMNGQSFARFTAQLNELRQGQGNLYTELQQVSPELVRQLALTSDTSDAINLLARAYSRATDQIQKNAIARAAFGRAGFAQGRVLQDIADAGGVGKVTADMNELDRVTSAQIRHWEELGNSIEVNMTLARRNISSVFAGQTLEIMNQMSEKFLEFSRRAKEFTVSSDLRLLLTIPRGLTELIVGPKAAEEVFGARPKVTIRKASPFVPSLLDDPIGSSPNVQNRLDPQFIAAQSKEMISLLGSAATIEQKRRAAVDQLNAAISKNTDLEKYRGQAIRGINLDLDTAAINARVSALGLMATEQDVARQSQDRLTKANIDGARISREQADILIEADRVRLNSQKQQVDLQYGLASSQEVLNQKTAEFINLSKQRGYSDAQIVEGLKAVKLASDAAYESSRVAVSALPQMTQMALDFSNGAKQLDQFGVSTFNNLSTAIVDTIDHSKTFSEAFANLGKTVARAAEEMIVKFAILGPLMKALGLGGGGGIFSLFGLKNGAAFGPEFNTAFANGGVFDRGSFFKKFALGDVVNSPTVAPMALFGEAGPEAIMPLERGAGGKLGVRARGGDSGPPIILTFHNDFRGAAPEAVAAISQKLNSLQKQVQKMPETVKALRAYRPSVR